MDEALDAESRFIVTHDPNCLGNDTWRDDGEGYGGRIEVTAGLADWCSVDAQVIYHGYLWRKAALVGATDRPDLCEITEVHDITSADLGRYVLQAADYVVTLLSLVVLRAIIGRS